MVFEKNFLEGKWWRLWQYLKLRSGGSHFGRSEADSKWKILSWMDQDLLYQVTPSSRYHTRVSTKQRSRSDPSLVKITCWNIRIQKRETNQWFQWNRQFYQWINEIFIIWRIFHNILLIGMVFEKNSRFCLHLMVKFEKNDTQEIFIFWKNQKIGSCFSRHREIRKLENFFCQFENSKTNR